MTRTGFPARQAMQLLAIAAAALICGAAANGPAGAQAEADSHEANEHITIHAPDYVAKRAPLPGRPYGLQNAEVISLEKAVSYADLDLTKPADVEELQKRIADTAKDVCQELNRRYPRTSFQVVVDRDCVKSAIDNAIDVEKLVVAASK